MNEEDEYSIRKLNIPYYLVDNGGSSEKSKSFLSDGYWQPDRMDLVQSEYDNLIPGSILILKHLMQTGILDIWGIGYVEQVQSNLVRVKWEELRWRISVDKKENFGRTLMSIDDEFVKKVIAEFDRRNTVQNRKKFLLDAASIYEKGKPLSNEIIEENSPFPPTDDQIFPEYEKKLIPPLIQAIKNNPLNGKERSFYLIGKSPNSKKSIAEIIDQGWWELPEESFSQEVNSAKIGDVVLANSAIENSNGLFIDIYAIGVIQGIDLKSTLRISINWHKFFHQIDVTYEKGYTKSIYQIENESLDNILTELLLKHADLKEIINGLTFDVGIGEKLFLKLKSNSKFWFLNDLSENIVKSDTFRVELNDDSPSGFKIGDLVLCYSHSEELLLGIAEVKEISFNSISLIYLYSFTTYIDYDLITTYAPFPLSVDNKNIFLEELHQIDYKLLLKIINVTEISGLQAPIFDINRDLSNENSINFDNAVTSKDNIPFHLDQVEVTDRLDREPIAKSLTRLLNDQIFASSLKKSFYFIWSIWFFRFLRIHVVTAKWSFTNGISDWLNNWNEAITKEEASRHAFMIHLQGAWGDGKSTFLNLIESNLNSKDSKWIVVNFNAWQHQHVSPPWWPFLDQIYNQIAKKLPWWKSISLWLIEFFRRIFNVKLVYRLINFLVVIGLTCLVYFNSQRIIDFANEGLAVSRPNSDTVIFLAKILAALGAIIGIFYTVAQFFVRPIFLKSPETAKTFQEQVEDPMMKIKRHFEALISNVETSGYRVAIFIDDIDRCNAKEVVQLLEGIQTLYRDRKVLYVVAGDKNWISECFEKYYADFNDVVKRPGQKLGYFFLEKAFQLSIRLPQVSGKVKQEYWQFILDPGKKNDPIIKVETKKEKELIQKEDDELKAKFNKRFDRNKYASAEHIEEITKELDMTEAKATDFALEALSQDSEDVKHRLLNHSELIEANPRSIKRLANQYTVYRDILIAEKQTFNSDKLFRWLIIQNAYPLYSDLVEKDLRIYTKDDLPKSLQGLADNEHWQMLLMDSKKERGGKLEIKDIEQIIGIEKITNA